MYIVVTMIIKIRVDESVRSLILCRNEKFIYDEKIDFRNQKFYPNFCNINFLIAINSKFVLIFEHSIVFVILISFEVAKLYWGPFTWIL